MEKKLKIGLIGCGIWGKNILRDLILLGVEVYVYEVDEKEKENSLKLGANKYITKMEELSYLDGIIISTPATTHANILNSLEDFDRPIFVEKPLCTSESDLESIKKLADKDIFLMHIWRYHAGIIELGKINKSKELGELVRLKTSRTNWTSPRVDTDSVWTLAPHDITIALEILGYIPKPNYATCEVYNGEPKGMVAVLGKSSEFIFEVSNRYFDKKREVRGHFEKGVAVLKDEKVNFLEIYHGDENSKLEKVKVEKRYFNNDFPLKKELSAFIDYINCGEPPKSNLQEGIDVIETVLKLRELTGLH
ncbi:MAG: Gfo/Idh/MocA family protein [Thermodesulfobacteriota bacterium]